MKEKAIEKLKSEMEKEKSSYIQVVGKFLLQQVEIIPDAAEKVLEKDKSIMKSLTAMRKAAEKQKVGNMAVLSDDEGFAVVLEYFGIKRKGIPQTPVQAGLVEERAKTSADFDVSLEEFLR
ncbi:hypothetical protein [Cytobacillus sp.]|uniref:hypothetical protein n=1 Tax=Cytobacillus sp. TaxID=2675269 RepID=UPI003517CE96